MGSHLELAADFAVICQRGKPAYDIPYQLGAELKLDPPAGGFVMSRSTHAGLEVAAVGEAAGHPPAARCDDTNTAVGRQVSHE